MLTETKSDYSGRLDLCQYERHIHEQISAPSNIYDHVIVLLKGINGRANGLEPYMYSIV